MENAMNLVETVLESSDSEETTAAQESVKEQLLLSALPQYVPLTGDNHHFVVDQLFSCKDCGDRFLLESSLVHHIERRSVLLAYGCRKCKRTVIFYNRCALLAHLREHSTEPVNCIQSNREKNNTSTCEFDIAPDSLMMSPLPRDKIPLGPFAPLPVDVSGHIIRERGCQTGSFVSILKLSNQVTSDGNKSISGKNGKLRIIINNNEQTQMSEDKGSQTLGSSDDSISSRTITTGNNTEGISKTKNGVPETKDISSAAECNEATSPVETLWLHSSEVSTLDDSELDTGITGSPTCRECATIPVNGEMKDHFLGRNMPSDNNLTCKICSLILPSKCSFLAHKRIHTMSRPYICPECAREFGLWASFSVHLHYTCFHLCKIVCYKCLQCKHHFPTSVSLEVHILKQHVKHVYKCTACPIACFSVQALHDHKINMHGQTTLTTVSYQQCQICPDRLIPKSRLLFHVNEHSKDPSIRMYVYQCSDCKIYVQKKIDIIAHKNICPKNRNVKKITVSQPSNPTEGTSTPKIVLSPDGSQKKNSVKIVYKKASSGQKPVQFAVLPKTSLTNLNKIIISRPQDNKIVPKFSIGQKTSPPVVYVSSIENNATRDTKNSLERVNKIGNDMQKDMHNDKKCVAPSQNKCETNPEESEVLLSSVANDPVVGEKDPLSLEDMDSPNSSSESVSPNKSATSFRLCSMCKKELVLLPHDLSMTDFPAWCFTCSKERSIVKKDGRYVFVSKGKVLNSENLFGNNNNARFEIVSQLKSFDGTNPSNVSPHTKRTTNSIALNGPPKIKRLKVTPTDLEGNKYRCHICKVLISMEGTMIQEHFTAKHPSYNLLVLSPVLNKLKLNSSAVKAPFIVKDQTIYPKNTYFNNTEINEDTSELNDIRISDVQSLSDDYDLNENNVKEEFENADEIEIEENGGLDESMPCTKKNYITSFEYNPSKFRKKKKFYKSSDKEDVKLYSTGQVVPPLEQICSSDHKYECFKCNFSATDRKTFREHIVLHRTEESTFQCMECGMCFVVRPSFQKHLFVSHRIKDAESYIKNNSCCENSSNDDDEADILQCKETFPIIEDEDFPPDLVENQCSVCREIFDTSFDLNKHFRTHGMAFLLQKKRKNKIL